MSDYYQEAVDMNSEDIYILLIYIIPPGERKVSMQMKDLANSKVLFILRKIPPLLEDHNHCGVLHASQLLVIVALDKARTQEHTTRVLSRQRLN